jgi:hypothetical protein
VGREADQRVGRGPRHGMIPLEVWAAGKMKELGNRRYLCESHWSMQGLPTFSSLPVAWVNRKGGAGCCVLGFEAEHIKLDA